MRGPSAALLLSLALALAPGTAPAAPVDRGVELTLSIDVIGFDPFSYYGVCYGCAEFSLTAAGTVRVDSAAGTFGLDAGLLQLTAPRTLPVEAGTVALAVSLPRLTNLSGVFSVGGAAGHAGEPPCPLATAGACVGQSGFGGSLGLTGTYNVTVVPGLIVIPIALTPVGRAGPPITIGTPLNQRDGAPWTVGTASITQGSVAWTSRGSIGTDQVRLVAPTYVLSLGNLFPIFTTLTIEFTDGLGVPGFVSGTVPEPALAAFLAACVLGVLAVSRP